MDRYTSEEVIFESNMKHKGVSAADLKSKRKQLWDEFFSKPQTCLRASGLPKKYGWGISCNREGKVALCPMESAEYKRAKAGGIPLKHIKTLDGLGRIRTRRKRG